MFQCFSMTSLSLLSLWLSPDWKRDSGCLWHFQHCWAFLNSQILNDKFEKWRAINRVQKKNLRIFKKAAAKWNSFVQIGYRGRQQAAFSGRTKRFKEEWKYFGGRFCVVHSERLRLHCGKKQYEMTLTCVQRWLKNVHSLRLETCFKRLLTVRLHTFGL